MILLIDSFDSFTWNLVQGLAAHGAEVLVRRNDALSVDEALDLAPAGIVLGPGPGRPAEAGILPELLARLSDDVPLLGVCLGHQALVEHCGGELERDPVPVHGKATLVHHDGSELFRDLQSPFRAGRYHSLRARRASLPPELVLTAWAPDGLVPDGLVMGVAHRTLPRFGVQFHPESILTPGGTSILARFLRIAGERLVAR